MFWLSVLLAAVIGSYTMLIATSGIGLQIVGLALAGNAYVRLQHNQPLPSQTRKAATWLALAISCAALALGLYRALSGPAV